MATAQKTSSRKPTTTRRATAAEPTAVTPSEPEAATESAAAERPAIEILAEQAEQNRAKAAAEPKGPEVLVDLDEGDGERPTVRFEGELHQLAIMDDFSLREQRRLSKEGQEFFKLHQRDDELTEKEDDRLEELMDTMFEKVFLGSDAVKAKMGHWKRSQVVLGFTLAPAVRALAKEQKREREAQQAQAAAQPDQE